MFPEQIIFAFLGGGLNCYSGLLSEVFKFGGRAELFGQERIAKDCQLGSSYSIMSIFPSIHFKSTFKGYWPKRVSDH